MVKYSLGLVMRRVYIAAITMAAGIASSASGHHSNSIFDLESVVTLQGTVSRYEWRNPHVYVYVESRDEAGQLIEWQLEGDATSIMTRSGWRSTTLTPGDPVTVRMNPDRNAQRHHALVVSLTKADGVFLTPRSGGRASPVGATGLAGLWDSVRGYAARRISYGVLTEEGAAAQAAYIEADNEVSECIPYPLPTIAIAPYLNEIEILEDRVLIRTEFFNVERTIYMDGRGHPQSGELTIQGHSIGSWEGEILVVDTTLFSDSRTGNLNGVPGGSQKHVVERYQLSEDRTQLLLEFVVEDPEYMVEPMIGRVAWDHAPDRELLPFGCDPENARLYEFQ
jgi:hypothetical protein